MQSYRGSLNFQALGIGPEVIDRYFSMTASRIGGIGIRELAVETAIRHAAAFTRNETDPGLSSGGFVQWRKDGEYHMINPETVCLLQQAVRSGDYGLSMTGAGAPARFAVFWSLFRPRTPFRSKRSNRSNESYDDSKPVRCPTDPSAAKHTRPWRSR